MVYENLNCGIQKVDEVIHKTSLQTDHLSLYRDGMRAQPSTVLR